MALTKDFIVGKSMDILNRNGIDGLTMRLLAKELGVKAASLYWHFEDKAGLYAAIAERMCGGMTLPVETASPLEFLAGVFRQYRKILRGVRDGTVIFQNSSPLTPRRTEIIRAVSRNFLSLGVKPENLATASNLFNNYVLSFTADEERFTGIAESGAFDAVAGNLSPEDTLYFTIPQDFDEQFDFGLRLLFEGLARVK